MTSNTQTPSRTISESVHGVNAVTGHLFRNIHESDTSKTVVVGKGAQEVTSRIIHPNHVILGLKRDHVAYGPLRFVAHFHVDRPPTTTQWPTPKTRRQHRRRLPSTRRRVYQPLLCPSERNTPKQLPTSPLLVRDGLSPSYLH